MIPHLHLIPDPAPTPDEQAADNLDGLLAPGASLARLAPILARLPPEVADALAAAYTHACRLSPTEARHYRPNVSAIARSCGLKRQTLVDAVRRAAAASGCVDMRNAAPGVRAVSATPFRRRKMPAADTPPPAWVLAKRDKDAGHNQRGATMRATNARERAKCERNG